MLFRKLGPIQMSAIGFGGWPIGGDSYGWVTRRQAVAALARASEMGANFFDTADIYGMGRSENIIGSYIRSRRDKIILATKGGYTNYPKRLQDFTGPYLVKALEGSLRRLRTDYVDIYFLHSPPRSALESVEVLETLEEFRREGKIRFLGVSVREPDDAILLLTRRVTLDVIQVSFSLIDQRARDIGLLERACNSQVAIVVRSPLCSGILAHKEIPQSFGESDQRARRSRAEIEGWHRAASAFKFLEIEGERTLAQAALQFCIATRGVTTVIPGMKSPRQVEENLASLDATPLAEHEFSRIDEVKGTLGL